MIQRAHRDALYHFRLLSIRTAEERQQVTPAEVRRRAVRLLNDPHWAQGGVPGSVTSERKRCGKARCRCQRGELHGPYSLWRVRLLGVAVKKALTPAEAERMQALCATHRERVAFWH